MKAEVDEDRCRGHAVCWSICPEVFTITDDGYATVELSEIPGEFEEAVRKAEHSCPERAITVTT